MILDTQYIILIVMDPELKKMMRENLELSQENNKLLRKMHRSILWGRLFNIIYWLVIIGAMFGAYYMLQPFIDGLLKAYKEIMLGAGKIQSVGNSLPNFSGLLDKLPK